MNKYLLTDEDDNYKGSHHAKGHAHDAAYKMRLNRYKIVDRDTKDVVYDGGSYVVS